MALNNLDLVVPLGTDAFDPDGDIRDLADSFRGRVVHPVANVSDRNALSALLAPTPTRPLIVWRADAPGGLNLEVSAGGDFRAWRSTQNETGASTADIVFGNGFIGFNGAGWGGVGYQRRGDWIIVTGAVTSTGAVPAGTNICNLPTGFRPTMQVISHLTSVTTAGNVTTLNATTVGQTFAFTHVYPAA